MEEKEEKRKIRLISQIDNLLAIQGQAYIKGQLKEALDLAERIIELAKTEKLVSFIREQEQLIAKIKGIYKEREEKEKKKIRAGLISELKKLEDDFNNAFKVEDFLRIGEIIKNARKFLLQLDDDKTKIKWKNFEKKFIDAKVRKNIIEDIKKLLEESSDLKSNFQFEDLKLKLTTLIKQAQDKEITDYLKKLKALQTDTLKAEESYEQTNEKIEELKEKIKNYQDNKELEKAISGCESILTLAKSINKIDIVESYSKVLDQLNQDLKFERLKESIKKLNKEGLDLLKQGELINSLEKFKSIRGSLENYLT